MCFKFRQIFFILIWTINVLSIFSMLLRFIVVLKYIIIYRELLGFFSFLTIRVFESAGIISTATPVITNHRTINSIKTTSKYLTVCGVQGSFFFKGGRYIFCVFICWLCSSKPPTTTK